MHFKFSMHIHRVDWNKSAFNNLRKVSLGVVRESQKLSGHKAHRVVWTLTRLLIYLL